MDSEYSSQKFGDYETIKYLGGGRFADVYLAKHGKHGTNVAIKVIDPLPIDENTSEQFQQEARLLAQLRHPHIVQIIDFGIEQGIPYIVMDHAPNGNLRDCYPDGTKIPLSTVISYVWQIALALQHAHNNGVIHRDLKPENLLVGSDWLIQLSDFNLALVLPEESSDFLSTQNVAGSVSYIAPEQIQGKPCRASDQYALGIIVYEWISGGKPFDGDSRYAVLTQHINKMPPPLHERFPEISVEMEKVIMRALEKDPQKRFSTIGEFAFAFEQASLLDGQLPYWLNTRTEIAAANTFVQSQVGGDMKSSFSDASPSSKGTGQQKTTSEVSALINFVTKSVHLKIVYYGIDLGGKVENLHFIQRMASSEEVKSLYPITEVGEKIIYFELPFVDHIYGFQIQYHLYTAQVPVGYARTRAAILRGVNGIVFVADSRAIKLQENIICWQELQEQLRKMNKDPETFPLVMQWNNRDAEDILPITILEKYLNPYSVPSFEAVAETGRGVKESLDAITERVKATLV